MFFETILGNFPVPTKPVVRFLIPDYEVESIKGEKAVEEEEEAANEDKMNQNRKLASTNKCRNSRRGRIRGYENRNYFRREESIRKEVVSKLSYNNREASQI